MAVENKFYLIKYYRKNVWDWEFAPDPADGALGPPFPLIVDHVAQLSLPA